MPTEPARQDDLPADWPQRMLADAHELYAPQVRFTAPRRGVSWQGRDEVLGRLQRELAAMQVFEFTSLRRTVSAQQIIDEYAVRFDYAGCGIENVALKKGDHVELQRLRILSLENGAVTQETSIETWTVLTPWV